MCVEVVHVCSIYAVLYIYIYFIYIYIYIWKEVCLGLLENADGQRKAQAVLCLVFANSCPEIQFRTMVDISTDIPCEYTKVQVRYFFLKSSESGLHIEKKIAVERRACLLELLYDRLLEKKS